MVLDRLAVAPEVHALRPDFAVLALAVTGLVNGPGDAQSEAWLGEAEAAARGAGGVTPPHVVSWQEAYRAFGAKPQRTASSVEALWKRAAGPGLPRVNWLVDVYNAISVAHLLPVGGEDLASYSGPIRLVRATGAEAFDTMKDGQPVSDPPLPGEVVWADDLGVTCRRWNWRQCRRTAITEATVDFWFVFDRLPPLEIDDLRRAGDSLVTAMMAASPGCEVDSQLIGPPDSPGR